MRSLQRGLVAAVVTVALAGCSGTTGPSAAPATTGASASTEASPSESAASSGGNGVLAAAKAAGVLNVGTSTGPPIGFIDPNGEPKGIAIDICNEFVKRQGIGKLNVTLFPFASEIPAITSNRIDLGCDTFYVTPERQEQVNFTDTLFFNVETLTTQKGNPKNIHSLEDLDGKTGCTYEGTVWVDWLNKLKSDGTNVTVQIFPTPTEEFAAISAGSCDAGLIDAILPGYALQQNPSLNLENVSDYQSADRASNAVSMPLRKEDTDLKEAFDVDLAAMKEDGTLAAIFTKWNLTPPEYFINP